MDHTALDITNLSPGVQKALGPGPGRMMAARGMAPLPPAEQLTVLYQLSIDADPNLAMAAKGTAIGLPDKMLAGALGDGTLDARVIDLFARLVGDKAVAFDAIVQNPAVADETIAALDALCGASEVDGIAAEEQH